MAIYIVAGTFITPSGGTNGASVDAWKASRFNSVPAEGASPPSGTADGPMVVTSVTFGGPGAFQIFVPTNEQYYVRAQYSGTTYWSLHSPALNTDGVSNVTGGQVNSLIQDAGSQVYNVKHPYFGAAGDGVTDDTDAIVSAINAASSAGGGTIFFPEGMYLITQTINLPVSASVSPNPDNVPETPIYIQPPLRLTGVAGNSTPRGDAPTFGSQIFFNPVSNATLFNGVGEGTLEIDHIGFSDVSSQENLFIFVNNTVSNIHDNAFHGNNSFTNAWTDVIQYGANGGTQPRGDTLGIYQGQVSRLVNNACTNIRHLASLYADASGILISHNPMYNTCGTNTASDACILVVGPGAVGNYFEYNGFEMGTFIFEGDTAVRYPNGYAYGIKFEDGYNSTIIGNNTGDAYTATGTSYPSAQAAYYFSPVTYTNGIPTGGSYNNVVMEGARDLNPADGIYIGWAQNGSGNMNLRAVPQLISGGAGGVIYGPVLAAGDAQFYMQGGTQIVTTNADGWGTITFPAVFPNGLLTVNCQSNGDNNTPDSALNWVGQVFYANPNSFTFYLQNYEGVHTNNVEIAVTWTAIGF